MGVSIRANLSQELISLGSKRLNSKSWILKSLRMPQTEYFYLIIFLGSPKGGVLLIN